MTTTTMNSMTGSTMQAPSIRFMQFASLRAALPRMKDSSGAAAVAGVVVKLVLASVPMALVTLAFYSA